MEVIKFNRKHLDEFEEQDATSYLRPYLSEGYLQALEDSPYSQTFVDDNGAVFGCIGIAEYWPGRGEMWAILPKQMGSVRRKRFAVIAAKELLDWCPIERVESVVDEGFKPGHQLDRILGFELETKCMKKYRPGGGNASMYVRIL